MLSNDVVLIVDDSKFIAQAYCRVLSGLASRILIACDGRTVLLAAESCDPNIIVPDMLMPDRGWCRRAANAEADRIRDRYSRAGN